MKILAVVIMFLSLTIPAFAQSGNETITITTYYPSPHGVYGILRLYPRSTQPEQEKSFKGDLYYDLGTDDPTNRPEGIYVYNGSNWTLTNLGGGPPTGSPGDMLIGGIHNQLACTNAGGTVVDADADVAFKQCQFGSETDPKSACPSGWTQFRNWSTTQATHPPHGGCSCGCGLDMYHDFANLPTETCWYCSPNPGALCTCTVTWTMPVIQVGCY